MKNLLVRSVLGGLALGLVLSASSPVLAAKKPPPKPTSYLIVTISEAIITSLQSDGSTETFELSGRLHLGSQLVVNEDGEIVEFRLRANLMNAFATSEDDGDVVPANGSTSASHVPAQPCTLGVNCAVPVWNLTFPYVGPDTPAIPPGLPIPYPNVSFALNILTEYGMDGTLSSAEVVTDIIE